MRDPDLSVVAEASDYASLDLTLRFNEVSSWVLDLPADSMAARELEWGGGIIVRRGGTTVLSGPVTEIERSWDIRTGDRIVATGVDDLVWLFRRLALPVPGGPPYTASAYDTRSGAAETVMRQYVDFNAGPSAVVARRVPGLTVPATAGLGTAITEKARFDNLLALLQRIALAGGDLGFRIVQAGAALPFDVYAPTDKTASVIFSKELGNLRGYRYKDSTAGANYVVAAGQGELTARTFRESGDAASIAMYGRIEEFRDARDTNDNAVLDQRIADTLLEKSDQRDLVVAPVDTDAISYLASYQLGDRVTVRAGEVTIQDIVREVRITLNQSGEMVVPTVKSPGKKRAFGFLGQVEEISERVADLERNL